MLLVPETTGTLDQPATQVSKLRSICSLPGRWVGRRSPVREEHEEKHGERNSADPRRLEQSWEYWHDPLQVVRTIVQHLLACSARVQNVDGQRLGCARTELYPICPDIASPVLQHLKQLGNDHWIFTFEWTARRKSRFL